MALDPKDAAANAQIAATQEAALLEAIAARRSTEPLLAAKISGKEILQRLLRAMTTERGVQVESLLTALGSLAGFSCQMSIRETCRLKGVEKLPFAVVELKDGSKLFFGDALNALLLENNYSVWAICAGIVQQMGIALPDVREIVKYVTQVAGSANFGVPRIPTGNQPSDRPIGFVKALWPPLITVPKRLCGGPEEWPIAFAVAAQEAIGMAKQAIDPKAALIIVMESAIPMSKIDPKGLGLEI